MNNVEIQEVWFQKCFFFFFLNQAFLAFKKKSLST